MYSSITDGHNIKQSRNKKSKPHFFRFPFSLKFLNIQLQNFDRLTTGWFIMFLRTNLFNAYCG